MILDSDIKFCSLCSCVINNDEHRNHDIISFSELKLKSKEMTEEFSKKFKDLVKEKEIEIERFNNEIESQYKDQIEVVSNHFRTLHDDLYFREVELKRELQSYFNENQENLLKFISNLEQTIGQYSTNIDQLNNISKTNINSNNENDNEINEIYYNFNNILKSYNNIDKIASNNLQYDVFKFTNDKTNEILNTIPLISIEKAKFTNYMNTNGNNKIYYYSKINGFIELDNQGRELSTLIQPKSRQSPFEITNCFFFQNNTISRGVNDDLTHYMFHKGKFWKAFRNADGNLQFNSKDLHQFKSTQASSVYDGTKFIYLIGGHNGNINIKASVKKIYRFNIENEKIETLDIQLPYGSRAHSLSIDNNDIYIIGGYNKNIENPNGTNLNTIYKFNIQSNTIELVSDNVFGINNDNNNDTICTLYGCFISKNLSFYLIYNNEFYIKSPNQITKIPIKFDYHPQSFFKLLHNGDSLVYIFQTKFNLLFEFNTITQKLTSVQIRNTDFTPSSYVTIH